MDAPKGNPGSKETEMVNKADGSIKSGGEQLDQSATSDLSEDKGHDGLSSGQENGQTEDRNGDSPAEQSNEKRPTSATISRFELLDIVRKHSLSLLQPQQQAFRGFHQSKGPPPDPMLTDSRYWAELLDLYFVHGALNVQENMPARMDGEEGVNEQSTHKTDSLFDDMLFFVRPEKSALTQIVSFFGNMMSTPSPAESLEHQQEKKKPYFVRRWDQNLSKVVNGSENEIDWRRSFYLNLICHTEFSLTVAVCSRTVLAEHSRNNNFHVPPFYKVTKRVYASPSKVRMDVDASKALETVPSFPDICFTVDDYDNAFEAVVLDHPDHCFCVLLTAHGGAAFPPPPFLSLSLSPSGYDLSIHKGGDGEKEKEGGEKEKREGGKEKVGGETARRDRGTSKEVRALGEEKVGVPKITLFAGFVSYAMVNAAFSGGSTPINIWGGVSPPKPEKIVMRGPMGRGEADVAVSSVPLPSQQPDLSTITTPTSTYTPVNIIGSEYDSSTSGSSSHSSSLSASDLSSSSSSATLPPPPTSSSSLSASPASSTIFSSSSSITSADSSLSASLASSSPVSSVEISPSPSPSLPLKDETKEEPPPSAPEPTSSTPTSSSLAPSPSLLDVLHQRLLKAQEELSALVKEQQDLALGVLREDEENDKAEGEEEDGEGEEEEEAREERRQRERLLRRQRRNRERLMEVHEELRRVQEETLSQQNRDRARTRRGVVDEYGNPLEGVEKGRMPSISSERNSGDESAHGKKPKGKVKFATDKGRAHGPSPAPNSGQGQGQGPPVPPQSRQEQVTSGKGSEKGSGSNAPTAPLGALGGGGSSLYENAPLEKLIKQSVSRPTRIDFDDSNPDELFKQVSSSKKGKSSKKGGLGSGSEKRSDKGLGSKGSSGTSSPAKGLSPSTSLSLPSSSSPSPSPASAILSTSSYATSSSSPFFFRGKKKEVPSFPPLPLPPAVLSPPLRCCLMSLMLPWDLLSYDLLFKELLREDDLFRNRRLIPHVSNSSNNKNDIPDDMQYQG